jgi:hypothetical protein
MAELIIVGRIESDQDFGSGGFRDVLYDQLIARHWNINGLSQVSVTGNGFAIIVVGSNSDSPATVGAILKKQVAEITGHPVTLVSSKFLSKDATVINTAQITNLMKDQSNTTPTNDKAPSTFQKIADDLKISVFALGFIGIAALLVIGQRK